MNDNIATEIYELSLACQEVLSILNEDRRIAIDYAEELEELDKNLDRIQQLV